MPKNLLDDQSLARIFRHLDRSIILTEAELTRDINYAIRQREIALGITLNINVDHILKSAALIAGPTS